MTSLEKSFNKGMVIQPYDMSDMSVLDPFGLAVSIY